MAESKFPWERDALDFLRSQFPPRDPYRAWANFEFIADDGSVNEVDSLLFTPQGFFLVEIKSRPGRLFGDAGTWTWEKDGRLVTDDNPLIAANLKAKKLRSLLGRQKAFQKKGQVPFIEALIFCSAPDLRCELQGNARFRVCLRNRLEKGRSVLLVYPGLLARYDQMGFLDKLRREVERGGRLKSCWLLLPGDHQAMIDGRPVPLIGPGQKARIPLSWLQNMHRANGKA